LGDRINPRLANKAGIVPVDDLAEQVSIRIIGPDAGQDIRPEPPADGTGSVQLPTAGTAPQPVFCEALSEVDRQQNI